MKLEHCIFPLVNIESFIYPNLKQGFQATTFVRKKLKKRYYLTKVESHGYNVESVVNRVNEMAYKAILYSNVDTKIVYDRCGAQFKVWTVDASQIDEDERLKRPWGYDRT